MGLRSRVLSIGVEVANGRMRTACQPCDPTPAIAAELAAAGFDDATEVGAGGFGAVYRCRQRSLERTVAVKVLTTDLDPDNVERFLREQRAMGKLCGHPNIVNIFDVGATVGSAIHRHAVPPAGLAARANPSGRPPHLAETLHIGVKMAGALETAHRLGPCTATSNPRTSCSPSTGNRS